MSVASFEGVTLQDIQICSLCPKACMLHISFRCVPLQDIHICSLGYVYWQFFMSLEVVHRVHYPLLFGEDALYGFAMFCPSVLLTLV